MTPFPRNSKDISSTPDDKDSNLDPNLSGPSPETTHLGEWSTSRRELWCYYLYYVVRVFSVFGVVFFFPINQRVTMGSPDSTLARLNSRISSTSLAMTRASHHSLNHVAAAPVVCYRIWDMSAIVSVILAFLTSHVGVADDEIATFFLFLFFLPCVVNSIVLLTNGISFAIQAVLLLMIGAWADYGTWRYAGAEPSRGTEWTPAGPKQAKYFDYFYNSTCGRLVCMAWHSRLITMASRRRIVYPWQ
jgi:hypothetical protein